MTAALVRPPETRTRDLDVQVFRSFETCGVTRETWDRHVEDVAGSLYATYDWCRLWWRHYGAGRQLRIFVLRQDDRLVGLAPMFIETLWLGPVRLRLAKRVGSDSALTVFALPLTAGCATAAYRALALALVEAEGCDALWLGFTPANDPTLPNLRDAAGSLTGRMEVARDEATGVQTLFRLPAHFDAYLAGLDRGQRQNYARRNRLLHKEHQGAADIVTDPLEAEHAFRQFCAMHETQWKEERKLGHFGDWPGSHAFNLDLVRELSRSRRFRLHRIKADGEVIAVQYGFVFGGVCYWRLTARAPAGAYHRLGLGVLGLVQLVDDLIGEGVHEIEAGVGHYDYKLRLGGEEQDVRSFLLVAARPGSRRRARLFLKASDLLHAIYYRGWFLRLAPRLPLVRRPLWQSWIRSRL